MTISKPKVHVVGFDKEVSKMWFQSGRFQIETRPEEADIFCFIGGWDINPHMYGEKRHPLTRWNSIDDERDEKGWGRANGIDAFKVGICRGGQYLNVKNGGKMYQHVSGHASDHNIYDTVFGNRTLEVTSSHHQMMIPAEGGEVLAYTKEQGSSFFKSTELVETPEIEPEVIWYEGTRSLCFQPHPEWSHKGTETYFFNLVDLLL